MQFQKALAAVVLLLAPLAAASAQQAMTISGHVTSGGAPLAGALIRLEDLNIERIADANGRYSLIVSGANVRGQLVRLTARGQDRRIRYVPETASMRLSGGSLVQDFDLKVSTDVPLAVTPADDASPATRAEAGGLPRSDALEMADIAGAAGISSALAGRFTGVDVATSSVLGGSTSIDYRGPRSLLGSAQPLFVVDGVPVDNTVFTTSAQRYGAGGFDYGSPIQDIDLANVATVRWLSGPDAVAAFGGRAANGVVIVTMRNGSEALGTTISASQQYTTEKTLQLPLFQNQYGQGLGGQFQFFDGRGGGINDNADQSWGPALDGRPVAQASYIEPRRPDVRLFQEHASNVSSFFAAGRTINTTLGLQRSGGMGSFRIFAGNRDTKGVTQRNSLVRRNGAALFTLRPAPRLSLAGSASITETKQDNASGTGFNETNPYSQFTRMGRQVDVDVLRTRRRDATGKSQISWNYAGHNNPHFAVLDNTNGSTRSHKMGNLSGTVALAPWLTGTVRAGIDDYSDARRFTVAPDWFGGFPFFAGPGDFSKGGSQTDDISLSQKAVSARLDAARPLDRGSRLVFAIGADYTTRREQVQTSGVDSAANVPASGAPASARIPSPLLWTSQSHLAGVFGEVGVLVGDAGLLKGTLRTEQTSLASPHSATTLYPSVSGVLNLVRSAPSERRTLSSATLHASFSRSGSDYTPYAVETMYSRRPLLGSIAPTGASSVSVDANLAPETTNAIEVGTDLSFFTRRMELGLRVYREATTGVILPIVASGTGPSIARNAGEISNQGIEGQLALHVGDVKTGTAWDFAANASANSNQVDKISGTTSPLGPTLWGLSVEAREGAPFGVLMGRKYLRDASGALLLRGGVPLPDSLKGAVQLGSAPPRFIVGLRNAFRYRWATVSVLADGRIGGSYFSGTKFWGGYSGSLQETAFRPDSGLLIGGTDVATQQPNTKHVTTEQYYHALGAIQEPWVYSATYFKLREARLGVTVPTRSRSVPFESLSVSLVARNLRTWTTNDGVDPESVLSSSRFPGIEMGQLPTVKSVGVQVTVTP